MYYAVLVKERQSAQCVVEYLLGHPFGVSLRLPIHFWFILRQFSYQRSSCRTHGLEYQTLMDSIWPRMLEAVQKLCDVEGIWILRRRF